MLVKQRRGGGVCLSFDDNDVKSWYDAKWLFLKYGAKVTFFVSHIDRLTPKEIGMLRVLKKDGHEISSHSLHHKDIDGVITDGDYGSDSEIPRYIMEEIDPSVKLMTLNGLLPVDFAVPFNRSNQSYITALLQEFTFVRAGAWKADNASIKYAHAGYYTCTDQANNRRFINSFGIDNETKFPLSSLSEV